MLIGKMSPVVNTSFNILDDEVKRFCKYFKYNVMYAVKANSNLQVINRIFTNGIKMFDVASIEELSIVRKLFGNKCEPFFFNPIRSIDCIDTAVKHYNCLNFSVDNIAEIQKLKNHINSKYKLNIYIRLIGDPSNDSFKINDKFGCNLKEATAIREIADTCNYNIGYSFHVGSQCFDVNKYVKMIKIVDNFIRKDDIGVSIGGGFPIVYKPDENYDILSFFTKINNTISESKNLYNKNIFAEPGRALVANSQFLITSIVGINGNKLYINDGGYGVLFDAVFNNWYFPYQFKYLNNKQLPSHNKKDYTIFGPTCDGLDRLSYSLCLPVDISIGDLIIFNKIGAYGDTLKTRFNSFNNHIYTYEDDINTVISSMIGG